MREQLTMDRIYGNEIASLTEPHLACALLLDTSGSMQGAPIRSLNESIQLQGRGLKLQLLHLTQR